MNSLVWIKGSSKKQLNGKLSMRITRCSKLTYPKLVIYLLSLLLFFFILYSSPLRSAIIGCLKSYDKIAVSEFENYSSFSGISKLVQFKIKEDISKHKYLRFPENADAIISGSITSYTIDISHDPLYYDGGFGEYFYIQGTKVTTYSSIEILVRVVDVGTRNLVDEFVKTYWMRDVGYTNVQYIVIREAETWQKGLGVGSLAAAAYNRYRDEPPITSDKIRTKVVNKVSDKIVASLLGIKEQISTKKKKTPGGSCFIATAAFGTHFAKETETLREFRDVVLLHSHAGRFLVNVYYTTSPPLATYISKTKKRRAITRIMLKPVVRVVEIYLAQFEKKKR